MGQMGHMEYLDVMEDARLILIRRGNLCCQSKGPPWCVVKGWKQIPYHRGFYLGFSSSNPGAPISSNGGIAACLPSVTWRLHYVQAKCSVRIFSRPHTTTHHTPRTTTQHTTHNTTPQSTHTTPHNTQHKTTQHTTQHHTHTQHNTTQHHKTLHNTAQHHTTPHTWIRLIARSVPSS